MNPEQKMIAAAQRAARRLARAEGIPYQSSLDRIARDAGRSHWRAFCDDPVPVDDQARASADEPDFSVNDGARHLDMSIAYGRSIDATTMVAEPGNAGEPTLSYVVSGSSRRRGVDARGLSLDAMAAALGTGLDGSGHGLFEAGGMAIPFQIVRTDPAGGTSPRIVVELGGRKETDAVTSPIPVPACGIDAQDASRPAQDDDLFLVDVPFRTADDRSLLGLVVDTLIRLPGSHVRVTERKRRYDMHLVRDGRERLVHHGDLSGYFALTTMAKDQAALDPMEYRVHQEGTFVDGDRDRETVVHVQCEARRHGMQTVRIGLSEHAGLAPVTREQWTDMRRDDGMLIGRRGLLGRTVRRDPGNSILLLGYPGSGKTREVIVPAILDAKDVDVVVHDRDGTILHVIGDRLARSNVLLLDPESNGPRFNPLHSDMMPEGHLAAAEAMSDVLYPKGRKDLGLWENAASKLFVGLVDIAVMAPALTARPDGRPRCASLSAVMTALRMVETGRMLEQEALDQMISNGASHGFKACRDLVDMSHDTRRSVILAAKAGMGFLEHEETRRWTTPTDADDGGSLGRLLAPDAPPATVVVAGRGGSRSGSVLAALAIDAAVRIRDAQGSGGRHMHAYLDEFAGLAPMGWTDAILARTGKKPPRVSVMVACQSTVQLDSVSPMSSPGRTMWFDSVVVTGYSDQSERWRLMREFPGVARSDDMAVRLPRGRRQTVSRQGLEMLRG